MTGRKKPKHLHGRVSSYNNELSSSLGELIDLEAVNEKLKTKYAMTLAALEDLESAIYTCRMAGLSESNILGQITRIMTACDGCSSPHCGHLWPLQRKCCPDCSHK